MRQELRVILVVWAMTCAVCVPARALAQNGDAGHAPHDDRPGSAVKLSGTVFDTAGAVVAGAMVTIVDTATKDSQQTVTSESGVYAFALNPGRYELRADKAGFQTTVREGL